MPEQIYDNEMVLIKKAYNQTQWDINRKRKEISQLEVNQRSLRREMIEAANRKQRRENEKTT